MRNPQSLPVRSLRLETDDPDVLAAAQPERQRAYEQIAPGRFRASAAEEAFGRAALLRERWSCGVRVRCDRRSGYTVFAVPTGVRGVRWCGREMLPGTLMRVDEAWELSTSGPFEYVAFGVDAGALETVEAQLGEGEPVARPANSVLEGRRLGTLGPRLRNLLRLLGPARSQPAAMASAAQYLLHLAAVLNRPQGWTGAARLASPARRRAAVRRVEEYLDAHPAEAASIPTLCAVAGVSERTLEYAFREHFGMTPVRYQRLWRLNRVRRALRAPESETPLVTDIALAAGFVDLSRFACDYRALFGERPSETLRRAAGGRRGPMVEPSQSSISAEASSTFSRAQ